MKKTEAAKLKKGDKVTIDAQKKTYTVDHIAPYKKGIWDRNDVQENPDGYLVYCDGLEYQVDHKRVHLKEEKYV